jgi:hypothetical protein
MKKFASVFVLIVGIFAFVYSCGDTNFQPYEENHIDYYTQPPIIDTIQNPEDSI